MKINRKLATLAVSVTAAASLVLGLGACGGASGYNDIPTLNKSVAQNEHGYLNTGTRMEPGKQTASCVHEAGTQYVCSITVENYGPPMAAYRSRWRPTVLAGRRIHNRV